MQALELEDYLDLQYYGGQSRPKRLPEVLTEVELAALVRRANRRSPTGIRNRAILLVMGRCGLRVSECLALEVQHVQGGVISVREGKGGKDRVVPLDPQTEMAIEAWLAVRRRRRIRTHPLFTTITTRAEQHTRAQGGRTVNQETKPGRPVSRFYVHAMVRRYAQRAGITKRVHPHTLRHTAATAWLRAGFNLREVQKLLGHSSPATTEIYTHVFDEDLQRKQQAMVPLDI